MQLQSQQFELKDMNSYFHLIHLSFFDGIKDILP